VFSKYDVYTTVQSVYCYHDTNILINLLGIKEHELLKKAEEEFTTIKLVELAINPIKGRFTTAHLMKIHKFIFEDVYPFAGKIRREDIFKGKTRFTQNEMIKSELDRILTTLHADKLLKGLSKDAFANKLAYYMAELNVIHPFREGNGRATREFIRVLAMHNGYILNWANVNKVEILESTIDSVFDATRLEKCLALALEQL